MPRAIAQAECYQILDALSIPRSNSNCARLARAVGIHSSIHPINIPTLVPSNGQPTTRYYLVESQSSGLSVDTNGDRLGLEKGWTVVTNGTPRALCNCPDYFWHMAVPNWYCKHGLAVKMFEYHQGIFVPTSQAEA